MDCCQGACFVNDSLVEVIHTTKCRHQAVREIGPTNSFLKHFSKQFGNLATTVLDTCKVALWKPEVCDNWQPSSWHQATIEPSQKSALFTSQLGSHPVITRWDLVHRYSQSDIRVTPKLNTTLASLLYTPAHQGVMCIYTEPRYLLFWRSHAREFCPKQKPKHLMVKIWLTKPEIQRVSTQKSACSRFMAIKGSTSHGLWTRHFPPTSRQRQPKRQCCHPARPQ